MTSTDATKDPIDRARTPGHAGDTQDKPIADAAGNHDRDDTGDNAAGNPHVETDQIHALIPDDEAAPKN